MQHRFAHVAFAPSNLQSALFLRSSTFVHFIVHTVNISVSEHLGREQIFPET